MYICVGVFFLRRRKRRKRMNEHFCCCYSKLINMNQLPLYICCPCCSRYFIYKYSLSNFQANINKANVRLGLCFKRPLMSLVIFCWQQRIERNRTHPSLSLRKISIHNWANTTSTYHNFFKDRTSVSQHLHITYCHI